MRYLISIFSVIVVTTGLLKAQPFATVREYEAAIQEQFRLAWLSVSDDERAGINITIEELFASALLFPDAFAYPFDSLHKVGKITSHDEMVRVFTWEMIRNDGTHQCCGFVLCRRKNPENSLVVKLTSRNAGILDPTEQVLGADNWFGALYYEIIESAWNGHPVYTLLGYDANDIFTSRKIVDCFYLKDGAVPTFGAPIFMLNNKVKKRIIFEYSAKVSMSMRYDDKSKMIVFDHLSPSKPSYEGNFEFYGPDFSYDALKFIDSCWVLYENIDVRSH
jgi:hypothetical protein